MVVVQSIGKPGIDLVQGWGVCLHGQLEQMAISIDNQSLSIVGPIRSFDVPIEG